MKKAKKALKLNFKTKEYELYDLPDGATALALYSTGYDEVITCAECGKKILYRDVCISRKIRTVREIGYLVCERCYDKEWEERKRYQEC